MASDLASPADVDASLCPEAIQAQRHAQVYATVRD
jgi:hypothetical protein